MLSAASNSSAAMDFAKSHLHQQHHHHFNSGIQSGIQLILEAHRIIQDSNFKVGNRTSHNELERGRRAHLRKCMEDLKRGLISIPAGTRLTTLVILRSAKEQLRLNHARNAQLDRLLKRLMKDHEAAAERYRRLCIAVEKMKYQLRRDRRSGSECSVATTLSEDSSATAPPGLGIKPMSQQLLPTPLAKKVVSDDLEMCQQNKKKKMLVVVKRVDSGYGSPELKSSGDVGSSAAAIH